MSQETFKWNKRDRNTRRLTAKPYSRPPPPQQQQSMVSSVAAIVKDKFIPGWLKSVANFLIFDAENPPDDERREVPEPNNESGDESSSALNEDSNEEEEEEEEKEPVNHFFKQTPAIQRVLRNEEEEEEDNASTASSGCSSMAPTSTKFLSSMLHQPNNDVKIPKPRSPEFVRRYLQTTTREVAVETDTAKPAAEQSSSRKRKADPPPAFSAEELLSPSVVLPSKSSATLVTSTLVHRSPFYQGRTSFGGASSKRSRFLCAPSSTQVIEKLPTGGKNTLVEIKINNSKQAAIDPLSNAAKRILKKIEQQSTPIDDVKKIPLYAASQITVEPVKPFQPRSSLINLSAVNPFKVDFIERQKEKPKNSLKMSRPKASGRAKRKDDGDEPVERIEFTQAALPMPETLPVFSFAGVKDTKLSEQQTAAVKKTTTVTKAEEFTFSTPMIGKPAVPQPPSNGVLSPITFSEPAAVVKPAEEVPIDEKWSKFVQKDESKWSCPTCMIKNDNAQLKCLACEEPKPGSKPPKTNENDINKSNVSEKKEEDVKPTFGWGDKFKPAASTWECDTCMVRNQVGAAKCVACETPRAGETSAQSVSQLYSGFNFSKGFSAVPTVKFGFPPEEKPAEDVNNAKSDIQKVTAAPEPPPTITPAASPMAEESPVVEKKKQEDKMDSVKKPADPPPNNLFVFGLPTTTSTAPTATTASTTTVAPTFVFGGSSSLAPANLFSASNGGAKEGFKFSSQKTLFPAEKEPAEKPTSNLFKFGASPSKNDFPAPTESSAFKFSFGSSANLPKPVQPPVTSVSTTDSVTTTTSSSGQGGGFSFGSTNFAAPKPSFLFGSSTTKPSEESTGFKFSFSTAATTASTVTSPTFGFSSKPSTTPFSFGSQPPSSSSSSSSVTNASNVSFVFGSSTQPPSTTTTAPFTFGGNNAEFKTPSVFGSESFAQNKFQFGQQQQAQPSGFNFGQGPQMSFSPSFNFATASSAPQSGVFQFAASGATEIGGRNIKKAKRRLNPK